MSTIDPIALQRMHGKLASKGVDLIDAPVSGMDKGDSDEDVGAG